MKIHTPTDENIEKAAAIIRSGGLVSFPTETVYGLGSDAFNPVAVTKIFEAKERPFFDPLIVHIAEMAQLEELTPEISQTVKNIADKFWPGPLTIVVPKSDKVPQIVTSGLETVAVRMPKHEVAHKLIQRSGTAITAPSANPFGYLSPTRALHVQNQLGNRVDMILDGGDCEVGVESTIVKIEQDRNLLLRPGGIAVEELEKILGTIERSVTPGERPNAPGQLPWHYSPATPLKIVDKIDHMYLTEKNAGFLLFKSPAIDFPRERTEILSPQGEIHEAAANLFSSLHRLDSLNLAVLYAEAIPETGLGLAIMDRLRKASQRRE
ncbi:MAG: threonylcarbamoyl-AMP synthase [bacterium]|nr:threonylcarbamoyl-AMP synthase [bacterium]